ncbi:MAG TPA: ABC transporter ATP-binding protein [Candidatus Fermentibacter daniensis]|nr:ABC transporter ATP-binding protein [Candidatus Fermentibacter daniensis]HQM41493.1 ABC transporter ATP-binding protein [Candidatus Fermentibacter daniensis]
MASGRAQSAWRLVGFVRPYSGTVVVAMLCAVVYALSSGASIGMILPVFDDVLSGREGDRTGRSIGAILSEDVLPLAGSAFERLAGFDLDGSVEAFSETGAAARAALREAPAREALAVVIAFIVVLIVLKNLAAVMQTFFLARVEQGVLFDLRRVLFGHILSLDLDYFARSRTGELLSRMTADVDRLKGAISEAMVNVAKQAILLAVFMSIALMASWKLTLVTLAVLPPSALAIGALGKRLRRKSHRAQEKMADFASVLQETSIGIRVVKAFSMEAFEQRRFDRILRSHARFETTLQRLKALAGPLTEIIGMGASALIFWYGGNEVLGKGSMTQGQFFVFLGAALSMIDPVKDLSKSITRIQAGMASSDRIFAILDEKPAVVESADPVDISGFSDSIVFEGVSFAYDREQVLHGIDLTVRAGEVVALVGPSGAGKSTLADLLPRFIDPTRGRIVLDGVDIRDMRLSSLRALIGVVTQETVLFNDTIRNNIAYGHADLPLERVREAAAAASILDFIEELPEGFETIIGERGVTLSGGQRQRLAIARAILKNPAIMVLDEATSSLDTESERQVQRAIETLVSSRTALMIAHRLSTIRRADRIVFLEAGRIVETGTHEELLAAGGRYRKLYDLQFSDAV